MVDPLLRCLVRERWAMLRRFLEDGSFVGISGHLLVPGLVLVQLFAARAPLTG
jgi:hypothetical protein